MAWRRRRLILLIGALAATVPATATGSDVTTILVPAAAGGTAVVTGRPAPTPANRALALTPSPAPAGSAADPRSSPTPSGPAGAGGSPPPSSAPRGSSTSAKVLGVQPVSYWQQRFDRSERGYFRAATELTTSSDSGDYYDAAYYVDAYVSMWQATDQSHYLDRAISLVENMVSRARPSSTLGSRYHDSYLGWVSRRSGVSGQEVPLYESYMWRYVTRMIRVMPRTGSYGTERARLLSFTERNIFDKWMSRGARTNVYRSRTHMAAHWAYIGLELSQTTGVPSATRAAARAVARRIDRNLPGNSSSLHGQMRVNPAHPGAYLWSDVWGDRSGAQDVGHGNGVIAYVAEAYTLGTGWTRADMTRFGGTLDVITPAAAYVDGSGDGTGWWADGWVKLGRADAAVQRKLEAHQQMTLQYFAAMAANVRILTGG